MNKIDIKRKVKIISETYKKGSQDHGDFLLEDLIRDLFGEEKYKDIVDISRDFDVLLPMFEVAYSYNEMGNQETAELLYEKLLAISGEENNYPALNNLSNLKKSKKEFKIAFDLIKKAYKGDPTDDIYKNNYENLLKIMNEQEETRLLFKSALKNLENETEWAIQKLSYFLSSVNKSAAYVEDKIAIPKWQFKVLIGTDEVKAESLKTQWLERGYIRNSGERDRYSTVIYHINPYLVSGIKKVKTVKLNKRWFDGFENLNKEYLADKEYFSSLILIERVSSKYKNLMRRDFDELVLNYVLKNRKSAIVLSGSFVELLFTYYCEKKKIRTIEYNLSGKLVSRELYDSRLSDFLNYFEQKNQLKSVIIHIGNLTRIYRNFIHPGNELKTRELLDDSKMEICFHSVIQIMRALIR